MKAPATIVCFGIFLSSTIAAQVVSPLTPIRGNSQAKLQLVLYDDLQCPYCAYAYNTLIREVLPQYGHKVGFRLWTTFNPSIHPCAMRAAVDAQCLAAQSTDAYWDFTDHVHGGLDKLVPAMRPMMELDNMATEAGEVHRLDAAALQLCLAAQDDEPVKEMQKQAIKSGIQALPTLVIGDQKIVGARTAAQYRKVLDEVLKS